MLTDEQWARIEPLLPSNVGKVGRPFGDHRTVVEGIAYRYRTGIPWRDLPREVFGPWQTVWKRHKKLADDGTWDRVLAQLMAGADAAGQIDWTVSGGLDDQPGSAACDEHDPPRAGHRGLRRITRSLATTPCTVNPQVTVSGGRAAD